MLAQRNTQNTLLEVVNLFEDLSVQEVTAFLDQLGKWQIVDSFPDHKIQKAGAFGDFKIRYVSSFPVPTRKSRVPGEQRLAGRCGRRVRDCAACPAHPLPDVTARSGGP